jgi:hypothetical protein
MGRGTVWGCVERKPTCASGGDGLVCSVRDQPAERVCNVTQPRQHEQILKNLRLWPFRFARATEANGRDDYPSEAKAAVFDRPPCFSRC